MFCIITTYLPTPLYLPTYLPTYLPLICFRFPTLRGAIFPFFVPKGAADGCFPEKEPLFTTVFRKWLMAKALTGVFTITDSLKITNADGADAYITSTIPIGSLIDVGDAQALEIVQVDYIYQNYKENAPTGYQAIHGDAPYDADCGFGAQLMDRNANTWLNAADNNLISSSMVLYDATSGLDVATDFFPDDFQKTNGRFVVNDEIYLTGYSSIAPKTANDSLVVTVRIRAKVVKLSTRDWMAISLETVQNE